MDFFSKFKTYNKAIKDVREFPQMKSEVLAALLDKNSKPEHVMLYTNWFATKLNDIYMMPKQEKEQIERALNSSLHQIMSAPILSSYIYFLNRKIAIDTCEYVYKNRLDEIFFINQMLNDQTLLKHNVFTVEEKQFLEHFIKWIKSTPDYTQQSNLLDVLLKNHADYEEVKNIFKTMKEGESLYENKQNVHDEYISEAVKEAAEELLLWNEKHEMQTVDEEAINRADWLQSFLFPLDKTLVRAIMERLAIDRTQYDLINIKTTLFDMLFAVCNYIERHANKRTLMEVLEEEMRASLELCGSGYIARFINVIQGFDTRFQLKVDFFAQLHAKINSMIVKHIQNEENAIMGTYDKDYEHDYYDFIAGLINLKDLCDQYGEKDINNNICRVLNKITGKEMWMIKEDKSGKYITFS